ncbi:MAG: hypothetical protein Q4G33_05700 [bacterium]|nr:hypothetical protein [bacterium]
MEEKKHEDLRVVKTKKAIRETFEEMICEMDYEEISIKELTARAEINRKTFYLHYQDLDELLTELQNEIVAAFIKREASYADMTDIKNLIRLYFESTVHQSKLHEKLICSGSYQKFHEAVNRRIMEYRREANRGIFGMDELSENFIFSFYGANSTLLYRQWVEDGKKMPMEDAIQLATKLICNGMSSVVRGK